MTREELRDYVDEQRTLNNIPYHVYSALIDGIDTLEQEPKKGHWIMTSDYLTTAYGSVDYVKCSCCGEDSLEEGNYCPNCGSYNGGASNGNE